MHNSIGNPWIILYSCSVSKKTEIIIGIVCLLILLSYVLVGFYSFPAGDDFDYACLGRKSNFVETVLNERIRWNGRYFSNFLVIGSPLNSGGIPLYQWMPAILIAFTFLGSLTFFKLVLNQKALLYSLVTSVICFSIMPDITEGFYWYTGAVSYIPAGSLFLVALGTLYNYWHSQKTVYLIITFLFMFIASGFNEIIPILGSASFALIWIFNPKRWDIGLLTLFQIGLFYYVISAPGNSVRDSFFTEQHQVWYSFQKSWQYTIRYIGEWLLNPAFYLWGLFLIKFDVPQQKLQQLSFLKKPIIMLFILVGPVYLAAFGPIWSTGLIGQYRTENLASYFFVISFTLVVLANRDWILNKVQFKPRPQLAAAIFIFFLIAWKNQSVLFYEWINGDLKAFSEEMENRIDLLKSGKDQDVYLPEIQHQSKTLFVYPLTDNPADWKNQCYGNYYRTYKVYLKK